MKRIVILIVCIALLCTSCNFILIETNYKFSKVHFIENNACYDVESWRDYDNSNQVQIILSDGTVVLTSIDCVYLYSGICPMCGD